MQSRARHDECLAHIGPRRHAAALPDVDPDELLQDGERLLETGEHLGSPLCPGHDLRGLPGGGKHARRHIDQGRIPDDVGVGEAGNRLVRDQRRHHHDPLPDELPRNRLEALQRNLRPLELRGRPPSEEAGVGPRQARAISAGGLRDAAQVLDGGNADVCRLNGGGRAEMGRDGHAARSSRGDDERHQGRIDPRRDLDHLGTVGNPAPDGVSRYANRSDDRHGGGVAAGGVEHGTGRDDAGAAGIAGGSQREDVVGGVVQVPDRRHAVLKKSVNVHGSTWTCASMRPGISVRPRPSITRTAGSAAARDVVADTGSNRHDEAVAYRDVCQGRHPAVSVDDPHPRDQDIGGSRASGRKRHPAGRGRGHDDGGRHGQEPNGGPGAE